MDSRPELILRSISLKENMRNELILTFNGNRGNLTKNINKLNCIFFREECEKFHKSPGPTGRNWWLGRPPPDVLAGIPQNFPFAPFFTKFVNPCLIPRYPETPYMRHFLLNAPPARNTTATPLLTGPLAFFSNRTKYYQCFLISQKAPLTWPAPYGLPRG